MRTRLVFARVIAGRRTFPRRGATAPEYRPTRRVDELGLFMLGTSGAWGAE